MFYRLQKESGGYLSVEVIGDSVEDVVERFAAFARAKCARSGGTWAEDEIETVRIAAERFGRNPEDLDSMFELISPRVMVDGEYFIA